MKAVLYSFIGFAVLSFGILLADVHTDYSHSTDFSAYKTYSWLKVDAGNSLWVDRIRHAVDAEMSARGLTLQPSGGDVALAAMGRTREEQNYTTFYDGMGGGWFWHGFGDGVATTSVQEVPVGTLTVDMFDSRTKKLIWRGTSTQTLSEKPEKNTKKLDDAIADMFKKFPPQGE
jgi:hypothetical protein